MNEKLKKLVFSFFRVISCLFFVVNKIFPTRNKITVLVYHRTSPENLSKDPFWNVSPENFKKQIQYLKDNNYEVISVDQLYKYLLKNKFPNKKLACITFDDGYLDNYKLALPILKEFQTKADMYISTHYVNSVKPLDFITNETEEC